jgi:Zn-dependent protease
LPIAAAYEVAHNYPYVARNLGQLVALVLDPVFPSVSPVQPLGWLSVAAFWGTQVGLIVIGHVVGVVAAHYVAVDRYDSVAAARRGHLPLVGLMICYTVLSLWIVSQPVVAG